MKGREAKLREPPETHDLRKCPELSDFSKKESTVPLQIIRGIGKPNQCGYGFIEQRYGNLLRAVFEKRNAVSCHRDAHPFHFTVQKDKSELKIFFLLRDVPKKIPFFSETGIDTVTLITYNKRKTKGGFMENKHIRIKEYLLNLLESGQLKAGRPSARSTAPDERIRGILYSYPDRH